MTQNSNNIFDRDLLRLRRNRSANDWDNYNFLKREAVERLADCLADIARTFDLGLDIGSHKSELAEILRGKNQVKSIISCDFSEAMKPQVVCDEEFLPFAPDIFDVITSVLSLHHVNDLPGTLVQIQQCLKSDGLFIAILPGANTLKELRESITGAAIKHGFALSPRLSPLVEVRDAGALLQRTGFALPVINSETITVNYDNAFALMKDLRGMGESNVLLKQHRYFTPREVMSAIAEYYHEHFGLPDGSVPATFEFITMTGWKPHHSQQQAAERGTGKINLKQALE